MKVVVLLSGGLDSATVLYQALHDGADEAVTISFAYGSRHQDRELKAASEVAAHAEADYGSGEVMTVVQKVVRLPDIFTGGQSALMGDTEVPLEEYQDYEGGEGESITVVPFRNANLISAAVTIAEVEGAQAVYMGMHATDHGSWAYPDCSPEFLGAFAAAVYVGTNHRVRLRFPFIWFTKAEVVTRAILLEVPIFVTYSCYVGRNLHCGKCPTCLERIKAFIGAGFVDDVPYETGEVPEFVGLDIV